MQTFIIPGTIFGVVFNATAGASSCFFLSKLIGINQLGRINPFLILFVSIELCNW
jgi:hypothetical protein